MLRLPPVTRALLVANILGFVMPFVVDPDFVAHLALWPFGATAHGGAAFAPWQLVTYAFLHAGFSHLLFNMLGLWMFGSDIERVFGTRRMWMYYIVCVVVAGLTQQVFASATGSFYPTVGASGGVFGLLLAFGMLFPRRTVVLLIPPIPMPAWLFVTLYGVIEIVLGVTGSQQGVAHFAHLGGMVGGYVLIKYWRSSPHRQ
ncbi:MAG TPA: rhomboid family intramembrane serine protease [Burkholderiaceae bacterium]|nr:rhomboid family intramembrane serine protease [Burkholderiaceae bacterium]